jgi:glucokinase
VILAGDVGATKILLEAGDFRSGRWESVLSRRYAIVDFDNMNQVISAFMSEWEEVKPARAKLTAGGIGVAGPAQNNKAKMTHRPWTIDGDAIARRFGLQQVRVVNDLAAAAKGVEFLTPREMLTVQAGKPVADAPRVVMGVGTGLGIAYLVPREDEGYDVVPGEGGHTGFSPGSMDQLELWRALFAAHGRVEAEHVVSGRGLSNVYEFMRRQGDAPVGAPDVLEPAQIVDGAVGRGDHTCQAALDLFVECMGNVAGDHALACLARGGVFITGGVAAKIAPLIKSPRFLSAFTAKAAFSDFMMRVPVRVALSEEVPVWGAARWALE